MGITINISGSPAAPPSSASSSSAAEFVSLDAGASVALAPADTGGPTAHADTRDRALNGGSPPASLVREIEAALLAVGATTQNASSSATSVNAGAAPI